MLTPSTWEQPSTHERLTTPLPCRRRLLHVGDQRAAGERHLLHRHGVRRVILLLGLRMVPALEVRPTRCCPGILPAVDLNAAISARRLASAAVICEGTPCLCSIAATVGCGSVCCYNSDASHGALRGQDQTAVPHRLRRLRFRLRLRRRHAANHRRAPRPSHFCPVPSYQSLANVGVHCMGGGIMEHIGVELRCELGSMSLLS